MKKSLYEILNVDRKATYTEIKKSYYKLAKRLHPDITNADKAAEEEFKKVCKAWSILQDEEKRKRYDETGEFGSDEEKRIFSVIRNYFMGIIASMDNPAYQDPVEKMLENILLSLTSLEGKIDSLQKEEIKIGKVKERIKKKDKGDNILVQLCELEITAISANIENCEKEIKFSNKVKVIIEQYQYKIDEKPAKQNSHFVLESGFNFQDLIRDAEK